MAVTPNHADVSAISTTVDALIDYALSTELLDRADTTWARNRLLALAGCDGYVASAPRRAAACVTATGAPDPEPLLLELAALARRLGTLEDGIDAQDRFCCAVMGALMPRPSETCAAFSERLAHGGSQAATDYLYHVSQASYYVRAAAIERDIKWNTPTKWGDLEITINRSKPEKDPRAIAALAAKKPAGTAAGSPDAAGDGEHAQDGEPAADPATPYPACQLCLDNEGYQGRFSDNALGGHPARQNLRIARIPLGGQTWGLQYSPYAYYEEHCIVINPEHCPMHIDETTFTRLLDFVDLFPRYFIGSNADLPIVGGSILNHDHFQAGLHTFPMDAAPVVQEFSLGAYPHVSAGVVAWPLSVLRLTCDDRAELLAAATHILAAWRAYSDPQAGILAETDSTPHNTITPIARCTARDDGTRTYTLNLTLRCNITDDEHPLGVFHPHAHLHHIKRENIGLIEVMGLAILPGRLATELAAVESALVANAGNETALATALASDELTAKHADWALGILPRHRGLDAESVHGIVCDEVGLVFAEVLECAGVFKWDAAGRAALDRFLQLLA